MASTFLAFIDESGDDGLVKFREPLGRGGASHWLIISACVVRQIWGLEIVSWRNEITSRVFSRKQQKPHLHFADLDHPQRVVAANVLASKPVRVTHILAAKKPIPDGIYTRKNQLYFYITRYLIERISWLCRDYRHKAPEGDGRVAITFSRRGGMSAEDFAGYLRRLQTQETEIHWPVINLDAITAADHSTSASLQFADIAASAIAAGVDPDFYGNCESRYAEIIKPVTYQRRGNYLSYGLKAVPPHQKCGLSDEQHRLFQLFS